MVHARLEGDIEGRATSALAGLLERGHFGVRAAISCVESLADDLTVANDDGADHRVRRRLSPSFCSQLESAAHERDCVMRRGYFGH